MREEKASALPLLLDVRRMDENNRAYAYRMLRKNIMTLQLQPAMSRTPVHEALMMLKSEWLVDVLPQRGSIVSKISVPYLNEGFAMRRILEPALLRGLAGKLTREQLNEFQELLNRQNEDLYLDQDAADDFFISLDNDFHRLLYHDSGYDRIWDYAQRYFPYGPCAVSGLGPLPGKYCLGAERARADLWLSAGRPAAGRGRRSPV